MSESAKEGPAQSGTVQEVQGWFPDNNSLQAAIAELALERYDRTDFSLPEGKAVTNPSASMPGEGAEAPEPRSITSSFEPWAPAWQGMRAR